MEELSIFTVIIGVAFSIWLLTSAKFRKSIGTDVTSTLKEHSSSLVDSAKQSRVLNKVDAMSELKEAGLTKDTMKTTLADYDEIFG